MSRTGIALGSNIGDRLANLRAAFAGLREMAIPGRPVLAAPVYQTEPRFCPEGSPDFLNSVIEIHFDGSAHELLARTRALEENLGRLRNAERNAPRVIDIDLLYFGKDRVADAALELPHPRIHERRFVLQPLADIRPELVLPGMDTSIAHSLKHLVSDEPPLKKFAEL